MGLGRITDSAVSNNLAGVTDPWPAGTGGGIVSDGTLTITNSNISGNIGYLAGGGIAGYGVVIITSSTISVNGASGQHDGQPWGLGGEISGTVTLTNSTVSGNYAVLSGGGIDGGGAITNSTISGNNGGGISVTDTLEIGNSILNASGPNISNNGGTVTSQGYNVCKDDGGGFLNGPGDQINTDPLLGPLQDNGGPTFTHELLKGSPAIDAGDPNFAPPLTMISAALIFGVCVTVGSMSGRLKSRLAADPRSHLQRQQLLPRQQHQLRRLHPRLELHLLRGLARPYRRARSYR